MIFNLRLLVVLIRTIRLKSSDPAFDDKLEVYTRDIHNIKRKYQPESYN